MSEDLDVLVSSWSGSWTPLHFAAYENSTDGALVHCTPEYVNRLDGAGRSPLRVAIENQSVDVIAVLVENGASFEHVEICGSKGVEIFKDPRYFDLGIQLLPVVPMNESFLVMAACHAGYSNRPDILTNIINNESFVSNVFYTYDHMGFTPVYHAILGNSIQCVEMICNHHGDRTPGRHPVSKTDLSYPIHLACTKGYTDIFQLLYDFSLPSQPNILSVQDSRGRTPFHSAVYNDRWDLIAANASLLHTVNPNAVDHDGHSLQGLIYLRRSRNLMPSCVQTSIPCLTSDEASFMLHSVISDGGDLDLVEYSLRQKANPNVFDLMNQSPLILAAKLGQSDTCTILIQHGAIQSMKDFGGKTALHYAAANGHIDIVRALTMNGQYTDCLVPSCDAHTPLDMAFLGGHLDIAEHILQGISQTSGSAPSHTEVTPHWIKTLSLAVSSSAPLSTIRLLTSYFPRNWIKELLNKDGGSNTQSNNEELASTTHRRDRHPFLRKYVPYPNVLTKQLYMKNMRNIGKVRNMQRQQIREVKEHKMFVEVSNHSKKHSRSFRKYRFETHHPVHQSIYTGNEDAFTFLLAESRNAGVIHEFLSFVGHCGVTVAQALAKCNPELIIECGIEEEVYTILLDLFDNGTPFEFSLLHFIVSGIPSFVYKRRVSFTSLHKWPKWLIQTHVNKYCAILGLDNNDIQLDDLDQVVPLVKVLMKSDAAANPNILVTVLYAAVSNGLRPELFEVILSQANDIDLSIASASNLSFKRWPLVEAIRFGYYDLADLLLTYGDLRSSCVNNTNEREVIVPLYGNLRSSYANYEDSEYDSSDEEETVPSYVHVVETPSYFGDSTQFSFKENVLFSLNHISSAREFNFALKLLKQLPPDWLSDYLRSYQSKQLLYVCIVRGDEGAELGAFLINSYISAIACMICSEVNEFCDDMVNEGYIDSQGVRYNFSYISTIIDMASNSGSCTWSRGNESLQMLRSFIRFCISFPYEQLFYQICGRGQSEFLKPVLECDQFKSETLLLTSKGFTPLYCLAAGGHIKSLQLVVSYYPSIISSQGGVFHTTFLGALFYLCYVNHIRHPKYFKNVLKQFSVLLLPPNLRVNMELADQPSVEEFLQICFNSPDYSLTKRSSDVLSVLLLHVPQLPSLVQVIENFIADLQMVYEQGGVANDEMTYSVPSDDDNDVSEWFLKDSSSDTDEKHSEWYHKMKWYECGYQNISDWVLLESACFSGKDQCSDSRVLRFLEAFLSVYPPFNPPRMVHKGYYSILTNCIERLVSLDLKNRRTILDKWSCAVIDIARQGLGEESLRILKSFEQCCTTEFHDIFNLRKLMMDVVGITGDRFSVDLFEYLMKFERASEFIVPVSVRTASRGNIEAIKVLVSHDRQAIELNFIAILSAASKSNQLEIINYFYENQFSQYVQTEFTEYFNQDTKFWLVVFQKGVHSGQRGLAMSAFNKVPFNALLSMSTSVDVIHDACWWGMVEILSALCIESNEVYFKLNSNGCSPFQAALDSGNIGRISDEVESFPLCADFDFFSSEFAESITNGPLPDVNLLDRFSFSWFDNFITSNSTTEMPEQRPEFFNTQFRSISSEETIRNIPCNIVNFIKALTTPECISIVNSYFKTWGAKASGMVLKYILDKHSLNVLHLVVSGGDKYAVLAILEALSRSAVINLFTTLDVFRTALLKNNAKVVELLTKYCDSDVLVDLRNTQTGETILHIVAECCQSRECADMMISMLNNHIKTLVYAVDSANMAPLECAVLLGKWYVTQILIDSTGSISDELNMQLRSAKGWFSSLMKYNAKTNNAIMAATTAGSGHESQMSFTASLALTMLPSIRQKSVLKFYDIFKNVHQGIAESYMSASCGTVPLYSLNEEIDSETVQQYSWSRRKLIEFFKSKECLEWCRKNQYKSIVNIIKYAIQANEVDVLETAFIDRIFVLACSQGSLTFVKFAIGGNSALYPGVISEKAVMEGFRNASGLGQLEVMAYIMLNSGISHRLLKDHAKECKSLKICSLVFFKPASEIFDTLKNVKTSRHSRALMSQIWLMRDWGQYQMELVNRQISRTFSYPELLEVNMAENARSCLTIEMSSFPDSFNGVDCPFSKLAVVQSACVSHFVPILGATPTFISEVSSHTKGADIVLSCNRHGGSASPSYNHSSHDSTVTISYDPETGLFSWPVNITSNDTSLDLSPDCSTVYDYVPLFAIPYKDAVLMSVKSCLKFTDDIPVPISINTDNVILDYVDDSTIFNLCRVLKTCMNDLLAVLRLHLYNYLFALYTELGLMSKEFFQCYHQYKRCLPTKSLLKDLVSKVSVDFSIGYESEVSCNTIDSTGVINVSYVIERELTTGTTGTGGLFIPPSADDTTQVIGATLVRCEISKLSNELSRFLKTLSIAVSVNSCDIESSTVTDLTATEILLKDVVILRFLPLIQTFIKIIIATLYSCLESGVTMETIFSGSNGIKIVLRVDSQPSVFDTAHGYFSISIYDILPHARKQVLSTVLREFIIFTQTPGLSVHKPVAITSYIDVSRSMDVLINGPQSELEGVAVIRDLRGEEVETVQVTREASCQGDHMFELVARVGGIHVRNSPLVYESTIKVEDPFKAPIKGYICLVMSHPNGGCSPTGRDKPRLLMSEDYQSVREKIATPTSSIKHLSRSRNTNGLVQYHGLLYGRKPGRVRVPNSDIVLCFSSKTEFSPYSIDVCYCFKMNHGNYEAFVKYPQGFIGTVVAACSKCNCALRIHSRDGFSYSQKIVFESSALSLRYSSLIGYQSPVTAATIAEIALKDTKRNDWFNSSSDMVLPEVALVNKTDFLPCPTELKLQHILSIRRPETHKVGKYDLQLKLNGECKVFGKVEVVPGKPHPPACTINDLEEVNGEMTLRGELLKPFTITINLVDELGNKCNAKKHLKLISIEALNTKSKRRAPFKVTASTNSVTGSRTFHDNTSYDRLHVVIDGQPLLNTPIRIVCLLSEATTILRCTKFLTKCLERHQDDPTIVIVADDASFSHAMSVVTQSSFINVREDEIETNVRGDEMETSDTEDEMDTNDDSLTRSFFNAMVEEIVSPQMVLFTRSSSGPYQPIPADYSNDDLNLYLEFLGKILAKAIIQGIGIAIEFTDEVYKAITNIGEADSALVVSAVQRGFTSVIPGHVTSLVSHSELKTMIRGDAPVAITRVNTDSTGNGEFQLMSYD